ncbi:sensor histidine kinase [Pacificimonas sp. ICDLI1SI03]
MNAPCAGEQPYAGGENDLFLATLAHELKTPLGAICGYAEMLAGGHVSPDRVGEHAAILWEAAQTLKGTVEAMLDLARLDQGELELDNSHFDLGLCAEAAVRTLITSVKVRGVTLDLAMPPHLPQIIGDSRMVTQILTNLISNAIKYGPEGGRVGISASVNATGQLLIDISDDGPGLSAEEAKVAMAPFGRVDRAERVPGHGLGLPLTKALVELHDGTLNLENQPGCGTHARVILPASRIVGGDADLQQAFVFCRPLSPSAGVNHF